MNPEKIKLLHSRYNPQGEADRYINSLSLSERIRFFILIEPGLGYMIPPLKKKIPDAKIIALHAGDFSLPYSGAVPDSEWNPGMEISVQDFLEREIPDSEAGEMRLLEWRPALSVYGKAYLSLVEETAAFIKRSDANLRTIKGFGRSWFRNFFKNLEYIRLVICPVPLSIPLLVTGSGPGLEDTIPFIKEESGRGEFFVLASSSSTAALEAGNLYPDMIISTDGGGWARLHLYECVRQGSRRPEGAGPGKSLRKKSPYPLAAALTAALPSQCESLPILPISDGSLWQALILKEYRIPFLVLPQRGTVSASALDLAFTLTKNKIFIAGIDLENRDIRSHARPYSLDRLLEEKGGRLNPVYSQVFRRSSMLKEGGSYGIYASWFEKQILSYPKRLYPLGKNNPVFGSPPNTGLCVNYRKTSPSSVNFKTMTLSNKGNPSRGAYYVLEKALKNPAYKAILINELSALLFPGREVLSSEELLDTARSLAFRNRGEPGTPAGTGNTQDKRYGARPDRESF